MSIDRLNATQVEACMTSLSQWTCNYSDSIIFKEWRFDSFKTAIAMVVRVSELAESHNHHPEMVSAYTLVRIKLWTHDVQGLTGKDFELARAIAKLVEKTFSQVKSI